MSKITFREYYESKDRLRSAAEESLKVVKRYSLKKYCKIPLSEDGEKIYIPFKPKDEIEILWEMDTNSTPIIRKFTVISESKTYIPSWNSQKMVDWVKSTTTEIVENTF